MTDLFRDDRILCSLQNRTDYPYFLMHDNDFQSSKDQVISDIARLLLFSSQYGKNDPIDMLGLARTLHI